MGAMLSPMDLCPFLWGNTWPSKSTPILWVNVHPWGDAQPQTRTCWQMLA